MSVLREFVKYYKPQKKLLTIDLISAFAIASLDLVFPLITRNFVNQFIPNKNLNAILTYSVVLLVLFSVRMGFQFVVNYWGHVMGTSMEADMRADLFNHVQELDFKYFDDTKTGQIMSRLVGDLRDIGEMAHHGPEDLFISVIMIIGSFIALFMTNWLLSLVLFGNVIILIVFALKKRVKMIKNFRQVRKTHAEINEKLESTISGIRLCKSFANEPHEIEQFGHRNKNYRDSYKGAYKTMGEYSAGTNFLTDSLSLIVLGLGGYLTYLGTMNYGDLVAFLLYMSFFTKPIHRLVQFTQQYQSGIAGFERFLELMNIESEIEEASNAKQLKDVRGKIEFENVDFQYGADLSFVLKDFNLTIQPGEKVALVGPSGVGKTTVSHLVPRFYDVTSGIVKIDGQDVKEFTLRSLRKNIGFVQQDVVVFFGTVKENIRYGNIQATDEEIVEAAKKAQIHELIRSLPDGYDSLVGERGVKLSGGQKQRISLARVFLKDPPILILDEATSSLDNATEILIQKAIDLLAKGRTTIIVAHRLSTILGADEILVLTEDGISERGTHQELLESKGLYAELFQAQVEGFIPDNLK